MRSAVPIGKSRERNRPARATAQNSRPASMFLRATICRSAARGAPLFRLKAILFRGLDLHRRGDLFPGLELAGQPGLGVVERLTRHDVEVLLVEGIDYGRRHKRLR